MIKVNPWTQPVSLARWSIGTGTLCSTQIRNTVGDAGLARKIRTMDADALRALQAPLKSRYRDDATAATITLKARGTIDEAKIACKVETGRAIAEAGLHPLTGGSGAELCSGDMLLEALVACAGVTLKAVATAIGVELRSAEVLAEGDLDFRGTLGVDKEAAVGFTAIRLGFRIDSDADDAALAQLVKLSERYCVVYQTLRRSPDAAVTITRI